VIDAEILQNDLVRTGLCAGPELHSNKDKKMSNLIQPISIPSAGGLHKTPCYGHVPLKHASLFSGIGGFDLAAEWMGWENVFHCEINEFGQKVLKYYWPNAISYSDITKTDFTIHRGNIDVLSGGFPCQPFSVAGRQLGTEDDRHLWPEMLRAIREIQPVYVVGENVRGLTNWNGGLVFDQVQADLEIEGYEVLPFLLPACGVNAPHRRDRIWFVAYSRSNGQQLRRLEKNRFTQSESIGEQEKREWVRTNDRGISEQGITTNTKSEPGEWLQSIQREFSESEQGEFRGIYCKNATSNSDSRRQPGKEYWKTQPGFITEKSSTNDWQNFPTQSPVCSRDDGISSRLDGITFPKWRNESIKGYGNAIVPQVAFEIFNIINQITHTGER